MQCTVRIDNNMAYVSIVDIFVMHEEIDIMQSFLYVHNIDYTSVDITETKWHSSLAITVTMPAESLTVLMLRFGKLSNFAKKYNAFYINTDHAV